MSKIRSLRFLVLAGALVPGVAHAARPELKVDSGFARYAVTGAPVPLRITVTNPGPAFKGRLVVRVGDNDSAWQRTMPVSVAGSGRSVFTAVYPSFYKFSGSNVVLHDAQGAVLTRTKATLSFLDENETILCAIGESAEKLSILYGLRFYGKAHLPGDTPESGSVPSRSLSERPTIRVVAVDTSLRSDQAYESSAAYEPVGCLLLTGFSSRDASPAALKAIEEYAQAGGIALICAAPDISRFSTPFYRRILPATLKGAGEITPPGASGALFYAPVDVPGASRVFLKWNGRPVLTGKPYGAGGIFFLSVDPASPALRRWPGYEGFLKDVLSVCFSCRGSAIVDPWMLTGPASKMAGASPPSVGVIGLFLLAYIIILVPVNSALLRKRDKKEWMWVTTPVIIIVFTGLAWAIGVGMRGGQLKLNQTTLLASRIGEPAGRYLVCGAFMAPGTKTYSLMTPALAIPTSASSGYDPSTPYAPQAEPETNNVSIVDSPEGVRAGIEAPMWTTNEFTVSGAQSYHSPLQANLRLGPKGLTGKITNSGESKLTRVILRHDRRLYTIRELKSGETAKIGPAESGAGAKRKGSTFVQEAMDIIERLAAIPPRTPDVASIVAYTARSPVQTSFDPRPQKLQHVCAYVLKAPVSIEPGLRLAERTGEPCWWRRLNIAQGPSETVTATGPDAAGTWRFRVGDVWRDPSLRDLKVKATPIAGSAPRISFWNWPDGNWQAVKATHDGIASLPPDAAVSAANDVLVKLQPDRLTTVNRPKLTLRY